MYDAEMGGSTNRYRQRLAYQNDGLTLEEREEQAEKNFNIIKDRIL